MSNLFFESDQWQGLRFRTLRRYGCKCMACGATKTELHVDHIKPRSKYPELALDPENLQVLCRPCHMGKAAHFEDDFRDKPVRSKREKTKRVRTCFRKWSAVEFTDKREPEWNEYFRAFTSRYREILKKDLMRAELVGDSERLASSAARFLNWNKLMKSSDGKPYKGYSVSQIYRHKLQRMQGGAINELRV